jgi:hypothetical protein
MDAHVITRKILAPLRMEKKDLCVVLLLALSFFTPSSGREICRSVVPCLPQRSQTKAKTEGASTSTPSGIPFYERSDEKRENSTILISGMLQKQMNTHPRTRDTRESR